MTELPEEPPARPSEPEPAVLTSWFWVMTLQYVPRLGEVAASTLSSTAKFTPGFSRAEAFQMILDHAKSMIAQKAPRADRNGFVVLFFSLEPDAMP